MELLSVGSEGAADLFCGRVEASEVILMGVRKFGAGAEFKRGTAGAASSADYFLRWCGCRCG